MVEFKISVFVKGADKAGVVFKDGMEPGVLYSGIVEIDDDSNPIQAHSYLTHVAHEMISDCVDFKCEKIS